MPWGKLAMGGKFPGKFSVPLRISAIVQTLMIAFMAMLVYIRVGLIYFEWFAISKVYIWAVVRINGVSLLMNCTPKEVG